MIDDLLVARLKVPVPSTVMETLNDSEIGEN